MRRTLTAAMAAITLGGALCAAVTPAQAHDRDGWRDGRWRAHEWREDHGRRIDGGAAIAAGVLGLALGAAIADSGRPHHAYAYAPPAYAYRYRTCEETRWVWDPYWRRDVPVTTRYAC